MRMWLIFPLQKINSTASLLPCVKDPEAGLYYCQSNFLSLTKTGNDRFLLSTTHILPMLLCCFNFNCKNGWLIFRLSGLSLRTLLLQSNFDMHGCKLQMLKILQSWVFSQFFTLTVLCKNPENILLHNLWEGFVWTLKENGENKSCSTIYPNPPEFLII